MFQRQKNWISDILWKPKKAHSLEQLRYAIRFRHSLSMTCTSTVLEIIIFKILLFKLKKFSLRLST